MEFKAEMKVTAEEFFDFLVNQLIADIAVSSGKDEEDIVLKKGFSYTKEKAKNRPAAKVTVEKFNRPTAYSSRYEADGMRVDMGYRIITEGEGITVIYEEKHQGRKEADFLTRKMGERNFKKRLQQFEKFIIANREKV